MFATDMYVCKYMCLCVYTYIYSELTFSMLAPKTCVYNMEHIAHRHNKLQVRLQVKAGANFHISSTECRAKSHHVNIW